MCAQPSKGNEFEMAGDEPFTFLGQGAEFKGIMHFEGTIRIDGMVSGAIYSKGTVMLGEHAVIEGDISAGTIVSGGTINGNLTATERVQLLPSAVLNGDLKTPFLKVEEGVQLHGTCEAEGRAKSRAVEEPRKAAPHAAKVPVSQRGGVR